MAAIICLFYYLYIGAFWQSWKIVIGGVFLGLAIFSYFYRVNIIFKRLKEIKEIKFKLYDLKFDMAKKYDKEEDIEHLKLENRIERIASEIALSNKGVMIQMNTEFDMFNLRFSGVEKSVNSLIVRVEKLENDTEFIRASKKWKWVVGLALLGLITTVNYEVIKAFIKKFVPW